MAYLNGPRIVTDGLVLNLDAASVKSFDPVNPNVELLLHMDGANNSTTFTDSSKNGFTVTPNGNAKISTDQSKFGGSSAYFDGNGDMLSITGDLSKFSFPADFTVEGWVYLNAYPLNDGVNQNGSSFFMSRGESALKSAFQFFYYGNSPSHSLQYTMSVGSTDYSLGFDFTSIPPLNTWHHFAFVRNGASVSAYWNGIKVGQSYTVSGTTNTPTYTPTVGGRGGPYPGIYLNGHIDELRIVKGKALYTSNFTPERKPYLDGNKIYDLSGNENNGTLVNGPTYSGDNYGVLSLDGTDDEITTSTVTNSLSSSQKEGALSYEYWLQPIANIKTGYIQSNSAGQWYSPGSPTPQGLGGDLAYNYGSSSSIYVGFGFAFGLNGFVLGVHKFNYHAPILVDYQQYTGISHLVVVKNINNCSYYVNGVFKKTSLNIAGGSSIIGDSMSKITATSTSFMNRFQGKIFSTKFYNRELSLPEIQQNYNALKGRYGLT